MKNIFKSLLIVLVTVSFMSCSSDDDSSNNSTNDTSGTLVGTWALESFDYSGNTTSTITGQSISSDFTGVAENIDYSITFTDNPNEFVTGGSYDIEMSNTFLGQTITTNESFNGVESEGGWEQNGNTIIVNGSLVDSGTSFPVNNEVATAPFMIEELTDTTLILTQEINQEETVNGSTFSISLISESIYTRQ